MKSFARPTSSVKRVKRKSMSYLEATNDLYKEAVLTPDVGLCCTTDPIWQFPGLSIRNIMQEMNYGCGCC